MSQKPNTDSTEQVKLANKYAPLKRIVLDTPVLLNMVKHCRESESSHAQGALMGVMQKENVNDEE